MQINLGLDGNGRTVSFDLATLIRTRLLVQASSGGGKSWTVRRILEQTHGHVQHIVFDPEGEFSTLRERFDYVLVGQGGEVAAKPHIMPLLIRRVMELGVSTIIDLYEMSLPQRRECVQRGMDALVNLPKDLWHPTIVVLDEAHDYAPEKGKGGRDVASSEAVIGMAARSRKRQFCLGLATQRIGKMNKDATAELRNRLIGLAVEDIDRERAGKELGLHREDWRKLRDLEEGHFYAIGPALRINGLKARELVLVHIGDVQTREPAVGRGAAAPPPPRDKVTAILAKLADLPKEAAEEAQTVAALQRTVHEQRAEIQQLKRTTVPATSAPMPPERIEVPMLTKAHEKLLGQTVERFERATETLADNAKALQDYAHQVVAELRLISHTTPLPPPMRVPTPMPVAATTRPVTRSVNPVAVSEAGRLGKAERKILAALALYPQGRTVTQLALLTGYAVNGGGFRNALGRLRSIGLLAGQSTLQPTVHGEELGRQETDPLPPPGPALLEHWRHQLPHAEREILRTLEAYYPRAISPEEIASQTSSAKGGPYEANGGGFRNALGRLRTLELIEGRGEFRLADTLVGERP